MIQAANQVNQHMVVIKKDIIPNVIASIREEYIKECEYMYENNLQYVDDEFDEREFLTLFFGQYPNTVDYWYSKLSGELDLYNPLVIEYVQAIFKHEKDIVERLEHLKKVLNLKESIDNVNDLVNRLPKAGKTVKYKPNCYVIRNEGVENRCIIGDINKSYIDKIRDNRIEKVERVSFNKIYMEVLLEEMGMQGLKTSDDNKGVFTKNLFMAVIVFMGYSSIMAIVWLFLEAPDLAITEAAVGAGVDTVIFFLTLKKVHALKGTREG